MSRFTLRTHLVFVLLIFGTFPVSANELQVDFRYRPALWNTSIALPDDWQKTLVSETGAFLYDYPGPHSKFKTSVSAGIANVEMKPSHQRLFDPRTPIVLTTSEGNGVTLKQEAFAIVDSPFRPTERAKPRLYRVGREVIATEWAKPGDGVDPAFQHVASGQKQPIRYVYNLEAGGARTIAVGLIEAKWREAGKRILEVKVEGALPQTIDVISQAGHNRPMVVLINGRDENLDKRIDIEVRPSSKATDRDTVLSALWIFPRSARPNSKQILSGTLSTKAEAYISCGEDPDRYTFAPRRDALRLNYEGANNFHPVLRIRTTRKVTLNPTTGIVSLNGRPFLISKPAPLKAETRDSLTTLIYQNSLQQIDVVMVKGHELTASAFRNVNFATERTRAVNFWKNADLPWNRIQVPDAGIQSLLDSSVRNIFQARDIKGGKAEFRVGPTVYRDIWLVDGSFLLEVATQLGRVEESRRAIDRILDYQQPSGQVIVLQPDFYKETGITLWMLQRHARLTQDKTWLEARWKHVRAGVNWIKAVRKVTLRDPRAPHAGLIPPGHSDGGIEGVNSEYTNVYWTLTGLKASIDAARWMGRDREAVDWQREYDDFMATFQRAASRDMKIDSHGNRYLPILMNPGSKDLPQKAQWGFLHGIFPGKVLDSNDPIATGTLAMLDDVNVQGLVVSTGWMTGGIWTYFASFYAHAHLWLGGPDRIAKAHQILYSFANHASPLLVWREEQRPVNQGLNMVGDMPHNWASAEFIRLVRHMIAIERDNRLVLFEGIPHKWLQPGKEIRLDGIATEFGSLKLSAKISSDGLSAMIEMDKIGSAGKPGAPVVDLRVFKQLGFKAASGEQLPDEFVGVWGQPLNLILLRQL